MSLLDISFLIEDPDFAQPFKAYRKLGEWEKGKYEEDETLINHYGIVIPANTEDLEQLPQGDRIKGIMCFYSRKEIKETRSGDESGTSDVLEWRGQKYKVIQVGRFDDFGFVKAFATRMGGG